MIGFADLTPEQQQQLLFSDDPSVDVGAELVAFADLSVVEDITDALDVSGGDVEWDGSALVHRTCQINLSSALAWGTALVRVFRVVTDRVSGLSVRSNRGVFCLTTPDSELGADPVIFSVQGQDRTSLLDRTPGYSVWIPRTDVGGDPVSVHDALTQVYTEAGVPCFLIDSSSALTALPTDMTWPMISTGADDTSSTDSQSVSTRLEDPVISANASAGSDGATWRQIINDLHSLVSYRAVWADAAGWLRSTPYADPASQPTVFTLDVQDVRSVVDVSRTVTKDVWGISNRWIFVWSNMPNDVSGNPQTPTVGNGGVYIVDNVTGGPSSQSQRNGLIYPTTISYTAASASDLVTQGDTKVAADKRIVTTYKLGLHPTFAVLGHFDAVQLNDAALDGGGDKVQITGWTESLTNDDITVSAESV